MDTQTIDWQGKPYAGWLKQMHKPPPRLYYRGASSLDDLLQRRRVAIVGSRQMTPYGKQATTQLAEELASRGIVIISGLALGVDASAHRAAVAVGGLTLAVLPTAVDMVLPVTNQRLAADIVKAGGGLVSMYQSGSVPHKNNFVARNELVTALCEAVIIVEAAPGSGSLQTARFGWDMQCSVMAVPGTIYSHTSQGTNRLIQTGARTVLSYQDVLDELSIPAADAQTSLPIGAEPGEQTIIDLLAKGINIGPELLAASQLSPSEFNQTLSMLEINGKIRSLGANQWSLR